MMRAVITSLTGGRTYWISLWEISDENGEPCLAWYEDNANEPMLTMDTGETLQEAKDKLVSFWRPATEWNLKWYSVKGVHDPIMGRKNKV